MRTDVGTDLGGAKTNELSLKNFHFSQKRIQIEIQKPVQVVGPFTHTLHFTP